MESGKKIQRYDVTSDMAILRDDGEWVRYEDHAAALRAERAKLEKFAARVGYAAVGTKGNGTVVIACRMCGEQHAVSRADFEAGKYDFPPNAATKQAAEAAAGGKK